MVEKYAYRKQHKNRGLYAEIVLEATFSKGEKNRLLTSYLADSKWESSCRTGVLFFYDYFVKRNTGILEVTIHQVDWYPVDTDDLIVLFSTIKALCEVLNFDIQNLTFDPVNETFNFPDFRSTIFK